MANQKLSVVEICAGAGGQALGLEQAGFDTQCAIEIDKDACETLRINRPKWDIINDDLRQVSLVHLKGTVDLLAGGVPCPPFSIAGKQLGPNDDRDLFPTALRLVEECEPNAVMLENVRGLSSPKFSEYRSWIMKELESLGYASTWDLIYSSKFGVPQLRPRFVLVALKYEFSQFFKFPNGGNEAVTVADVLGNMMGSKGWSGITDWKNKANDIAPTIVGGSKKHGGADLGPTRAKRQWLELGIDGKGIANDLPDENTPKDFTPRLTNQMVALIQGFPIDWRFAGKKTSQYRQIGNAFPPPVAKAFGYAIKKALSKCEVQYLENEQQSLDLPLTKIA